jgi:hypothetical protein
MTPKSFTDLHKNHQGKVSDKWSFYLDQYELLFNPLRDKTISLFEIGIQNGGSLEVWSKYFPRAKVFVGCDIDKKYSKLTFQDPRINLVVGDANQQKIQKEVIQKGPFDIVIDDGSHRSGDIIKSFVNYFPHLAENGVYVIEDLHCSYWEHFEGGLFAPYSSMTFFKQLTDLINYEHWGVSKDYTEILKGVSVEYDLKLKQNVLEKIKSIEFLNSMCVIRKSSGKTPELGLRVVSGKDPTVYDLRELNATKSIPPSQFNNAFSLRKLPPAEEVIDLYKQIQTQETKIQTQETKIQTQETKIQTQETKIQTQENSLNLIINSRSWKITKPLRFLVKCLRGLKTSKELRDLNSAVDPVVTNVKINDELIHSSASFDALSGLVQSTQPRDLKEDKATLIAFYLPQYHIIPENSEWWGPGFTEWTNVVKGRPNFDGHYQPRLPRELGFYDLSKIDVIRKQAEMAKLYGVGAFCFYYYWFSGRRILEAPIDNFLHSDIDMPYCLCWANENWTRTWDGDSRGVLLEQKYLQSDPQEFIDSALPHFADSRYLKVDGKPMLVVYRAKDIPSTEKVFRIWRKAVHAAGFPDLHIVVVDFYDIARPDEVGADALVEFPPHKFNGPEIVPDKLPSIINKEFCGGIIDYAKIIAKSANRPVPDFTLYRGIMPSWDNTARRQNNPTIAYGSSPKLFEYWLRYVRAYTREVISDRPDNFIFINAWNEWGEGCHLEPDQNFGLKYLDAVKSSSYFDGSLAGSDKARDVLITAASASIQMRHGYPKESTLEIEQRLRSTLKPIPRAQKISYKLRKYPIVHFVGKCIYKIYRAIWFR